MIHRAGLLGNDGTTPHVACVENLSALDCRDSSKFCVLYATGRSSAAVQGARGAAPPSSLFRAARLLPSIAFPRDAHKIITTCGRDKLPDKEKSGALVDVCAGEQGNSAAASRARGGVDFTVFLGRVRPVRCQIPRNPW